MTNFRKEVIDSFTESNHFEERKEQRGFNRKTIEHIINNGRIRLQAKSTARFTLNQSYVVVDCKTKKLITVVMKKGLSKQKKKKYKKTALKER